MPSKKTLEQDFPRDPKESQFIGLKGGSLALAEVGLGSLLHSFHVPLAGTLLSLNQGYVLSRCLKQARHKSIPRTAAFRISWVAALLKSLSPSGKKLTPMMAIGMQGLLFSVGPLCFGHSLGAALLGSFLSSFWSFLQPLFFALMIYGPFVSPQILEQLSKQWASLLVVLPILQKVPFLSLLAAFVMFKACLSVLLAFLAWWMKEDLFGVRAKRFFLKPMVWGTSSGSFAGHAKSAIGDLKRAVFLVPFFALMALAFFNEEHFAPMLLFAIRPFAAGYLFFLMVRIFSSKPWPEYFVTKNPDMVHGMAYFLNQSHSPQEAKGQDHMFCGQIIPKRLLHRAVSILKEEGPAAVLAKGLDKISVLTSYSSQKKRFDKRSFDFQGQRLPYFIHHYNATWRNERCIEIAVAKHYLHKWSSQRVLELGNVMSYYGHQDHLVIDKYEPTAGVINQDFVDFKTDQAFDAFVSISTFEHIGWDEAQKDPEKIKACFVKIPSLVTHKEQVLVSFPLGYNDFLDGMVAEGSLPFLKQSCLIRKDLNQTWEERPVLEGLKACYRYGSKFPGANACFFGVGVE